MYLLDTNVVSELRKASRADAAVRTWAENTPAGSFWLSVITVLELEIGVLRMERRDAAQGAQLRRWLEEGVLTRFNERMIDLDVVITRESARLHVPDPRPERDALIGATALTRGLTVVTRNVGDFEPMGVALLNPWDVSGGSTR
jgi:predicted nucleic acid-binding protein